MNSKRNSLSMLAALLAAGASTGETFEHMGRAPSFAQAWRRFSPVPDARYLRRQTITRGERRRRGEVVR